MLVSPGRWNSFVKLIQASPRPWKWKLRNGSSTRCWAFEKTTSVFFLLLYTVYVYTFKLSSILLSSCFLFLFFLNCLWRIILGFQQSNWMPSMATIRSEYLIIFVIPTFFKAFLNFGGKTCQNSGRNICWLKGKNADRQSYCARALWISWPMGCRWGPWDAAWGNDLNDLKCSSNSPDESLLKWLRLQICNMINRWIVLAKDYCVEWHVHFLQFGHCACLRIPWIWSKGGLYGSAGDAWCIALWRVYLVTWPRQKINFFHV